MSTAPEGLRTFLRRLKHRISAHWQRSAPVAAADPGSARDGEGQFAAMIQHVPGAIYRYVEVDGVWTCTFMSDAIEEITGYPPAYFIGQSTDQFRDLVYPDDLPLFDGGVGNATDQGDGARFEYRMTAKDGSIRWIGARGSDPVTDSHGQSYIDGAIDDVTRQREAEVARARSDATFRHLFNSMAEGFVVNTLRDGEITLVNSSAVAMFRYPDDNAMKHRPVSDLFASESERAEAVDTLLENKALAGHWTKMRRYDGTVFTAELNTRLVADSDEPTMETTFRDVTAHFEAKEQIENARAAAEAANRAKSTFLANMSHELRTPLNAILGYSEMLIEEASEMTTDELTQDLERIHGAGTHLLALINDVLDLSKIEAGKTEVFREPFSMDQLIDELLATAAPLMRTNDNTLDLDCPSPLGDVLQDETKIRQATLNLLSNAAKFTNNGQVRITARRELRGAGDWITIAVRDTGIGLADDQRESVFEEFSQAEASTTRNYGGTGLGLAISRRFCRMLGGDITVSSVPGEGSTFTIEIPAIGTEVASTDTTPTVATPEHTDEDTRVPIDPSRTVLVIDDDREACDLLARYLTKDGFEVVCAHSGEQGLRLAREIQPAAITLDVVMPEMDGWSVLTALKADTGLRDIPIIMVSMVDDRSTGYTLGATEYLTKPVERPRLLDAIAKHQPADAEGRVLLVDDEADARDMMARILTREGWRVDHAENGVQALASLQARTPDLVLLDLMMPVMDGFDFLVQLRAEQRWADIPVVVITAKELTEEDRHRLNGHAAHVLSKGMYTRDQLISLVKKTIDAVGEIRSE